MINTTLQPTRLQLGGHEVPVIHHNGFAWLLGLDGSLMKLPATVLDQYSAQVAQELQKQGFFGPLTPPDTFYVTVIPEMSCNLRCGYCIQNESVTAGAVKRVPGLHMNDNTAAATVAFIERQRLAQGKAGVDLLLFGGEPLLWAQGCYNLLKRIAHLRSAGLVTNATRLSPAVAARLVALGVRDIQVTFDGAQAKHDAVRLSVAGRGSYETIVSNLAATEELDFRRKLRINLTQTNVASIEQLFDDLAGRLTPWLYQVDLALVDDNGVGWNQALAPGQSATERQIELYRYAAALGFDTGLPSLGGCTYCDQKFGRGGAVINADGRLYASWDTAGFIGMNVGDVWDGYEAAAPNNEWKWRPCGYKSTNRNPNDDSPQAIADALFVLAVERASRGGSHDAVLN